MNAGEPERRGSQDYRGDAASPAFCV